MASALVLVLPGLLAQPPQALAEMRTLATLARYAGGPHVGTGGIAGALLAALGVDGDTATAPLALLGAGGDPRDDYVLRADPVHLAADRDRGWRVQTIDDLAADDVATLGRTLDRHFAGDDLRFEAIRPDAWFARRTQAARLVTIAPDAMRGRNPMACMPSGPDGGTWKRWQNEIEMLLHDHAVNRAREARGMLPVNAVWFSGGGRLAEVSAPPPTFVLAPQSRLGDLARGIAHHAGTSDANGDLAQAVTRASAAGGKETFALAVVPVATGARELEVATLAPALELLAARRVSAVHLVADGHGAAVHWAAGIPRFWRRLAMRASHRAFEIPALPDT